MIRQLSSETAKNLPDYRKKTLFHLSDEKIDKVSWIFVFTLFTWMYVYHALKMVLLAT